MSGPRPIMQFDAYSLKTLIDAVKEAADALCGEAGADPVRNTISQPVWYRGHTNPGQVYMLLPGLYRGGKLTYKEARLEEEWSTQSFNAQTAHALDTRPEAKTDWLEVMQHYQVKTRLMDWSENMFTAAMFSLEPYISSPKDDRYKDKRRLSQPSIWLLNPIRLNTRVYRMLHEDTSIIDSALMEFPNLPSGFQSEMKDRLEKGESDYLMHVRTPRSAIVNLSSLLSHRDAVSDRLPELLKADNFNPFYYLLLRLYSDGVELEKELPPLAIKQPYHSKRIEVQHGVFTIFPFPTRDGKITPLEENPDCSDFLAEIRLNNPFAIAKDLRKLGYMRTDLYPELTEYGQSIEWR